MAVYGPSNAEELYHWKYKYKKRINGKWRYYYDEINLNTKNYKTLNDADTLRKETNTLRLKYIAETVNANTNTGHDSAEAIEVAKYYESKWRYYNSVYQKVLDQFGEEMMSNANQYMVDSWNGHEEFKEKYYKKIYDSAIKEAEKEARAQAEADEAYAREQGFNSYEELKRYEEKARSDIEAEKKKLALAQKLAGVQKRNPKKKKGGQ